MCIRDSLNLKVRSWHADRIPLVIPRVVVPAQLPSACVIRMVLPEFTTTRPMALVDFAFVRKGGRHKREEQQERKRYGQDS